MISAENKRLRISIYDPETKQTTKSWLREGDFTIIVTAPCTVKNGQYKYSNDGRVFIELEGFQHAPDKPL